MSAKESASSLVTENKQVVESPAGQDDLISEIPKNLIDLFNDTNNPNENDRFYLVFLKRNIDKIRAGIDEILRVRYKDGELGPVKNEKEKCQRLSLYLYNTTFKGKEGRKPLDYIALLKEHGYLETIVVEGMPVAIVDRRATNVQYSNVGGRFIENFGIVYFYEGKKSPPDIDQIKSVLRHEFIHLGNRVLGIKDRIFASESNESKATLLWNFINEFLAYRTNDPKGFSVNSSASIENNYFRKDMYLKMLQNPNLNGDHRSEISDISSINTLNISLIWLKIIQKLWTDETGVMANKLKAYLLMNVKTLDDLDLSIPANKTKFEAATGLHLGEDIYGPKKDEVLPSPISQ